MVHANLFPAEDAARFPDNAWADPITGALVVTSARGIVEDRSYGRLLTAFGVTRAESRLADAVLSGLSLDQFAELQGLSSHTVRNQMRALLRKTETRTQQDFIRKILLLINPIEVLHS
jgi:DNA-binding CsgD family transcriptional regulator